MRKRCEKFINNLKLFSLLLAGAILFTSCEWIQMKRKPALPEEPEPLARVQDKYLYKSDIEGIASLSSTPADSVNTVQRYIQNWIRKQLMLSEASTQIEFDQAELQRKILDYRYALMVYEFEKQYISERLDKQVTDQEIEDYYKQNQENFQLKQSIVRCVFLQISKDSRKIRDIKRAINARSEEAKAELRSFSLRYAAKSHVEDSIWLKFDEVFGPTPLEIPNRVQFLKENINRLIEAKDDNYVYLIKLLDYKIKDQISPLDFVKDDIRKIIINKRKTTLAKELENKIYDRAVKNEEFEVYVEN